MTRHRTTDTHPLPLDLVLTDDGLPPHRPADCAVCALFTAPIARLGALYRASPDGRTLRRDAARAQERALFAEAAKRHASLAALEAS